MTVDASRATTVALIPIVPLGMSLGLFFVISYAACVLLYLVAPELFAGHAILALLLSDFEGLGWRGFLLGLLETFGYGWYVALIFGPLYNFFAGRRR